MNHKVILMRGIQGSGKSTWAHKWVSEDPINRVRWNNNDFRRMLGPYWVIEREDLISKVFWDFMLDALSKGKDVVIDNMNLNPKTVQSIEKFVFDFNEGVAPHTTEHHHYDIEYQDCFISVEECIERDKLRKNPIGENVIRATWRKYKNFIIEEENKKLAKSLIKEDRGIYAHAIIVDMDATLALNISGRPFYGTGCAEGIKDDLPIFPIISIVNNYKLASSFHYVIVLTGREDTEEIRKATENWLRLNGVKFDFLLMRPKGDYSKGECIKRDIYIDHIKPHYEIDYVIDDSQKCVKMWRELGLLCLQPNEGKF